MIQVPIQAIPNQELSITAGGFRHTITIKEANGIMAFSVVIDDVTIIESIRIVSGQPIIPYQYLESGNFTILTLDDEIPYYNQFGTSQFLYYLTPDELEASRA